MRVAIRMSRIEEQNVVGVGNQSLAVLGALKDAAANEHNAVSPVWFLWPQRLNVGPAAEINDGDPHGFVEKAPCLRGGAVVGQEAHRSTRQNKRRSSPRSRRKADCTKQYLSSDNRAGRSS